MSESKEKHIIRSWQKNAKAWTSAIQNEEIESRKLITNKAIVEAAENYKPSNALDVGCGEGWLTRALINKGIKTTGVDVTPELIKNARKLGAGTFEVFSYENIAGSSFNDNNFDAVFCNFSLLGMESVESLIKAVPSLLSNEGHLFIQTLHPLSACGDNPYINGWRQGSWAGFNNDFADPAPWYFRTIGSWIKMLIENELKLIECREPLHPVTKKPASIIFICEKLKD